MLAFKKILTPTDFSERSLPAIRFAVEVARHFSAELTAVHVMTPTVPVGPTVGGHSPVNLEVFHEAVVGDARDRLDEVVSRIIPDDVTCRTEVRWGSPAETIVELADSDEYDLIVISTRGATGLSRFVAGSVTEKVVRLANVPVLTVQAEDQD